MVALVAELQNHLYQHRLLLESRFDFHHLDDLFARKYVATILLSIYAMLYNLD